MGKYFGIKIMLSILLISAFGIAGFWFFRNELTFTAVFFLLIALILLVELYRYINKPFQEVHKTISSMFHEDFSLQSPSPQKNELFSDLTGLYAQQKQNYFERQSVKIIYDNILNSISTGILILRKTTIGEWEIFMMNRTFANILQIPVYASWRIFRKNVPEFAQKLEEINFSEIQQSIEISVDNQENQTYSLKTSTIKTYNFDYFIVALDSVQSIVEKKEKQAWHDLMKVISHEMMNTLTPINSLVNSLQYFGEQNEWNADDKKDFKISLETIQKKTVHMLEFVDNYRQLSNLPQPKMSETDLVTVVRSCIEVMKPLLDKNEISLHFDAQKEEILLDIDPMLTERVVINLLTNSIYAVQDNEVKKEISIKIYRQNPRVFIEIKDDGTGIEKEIRDKVFIPFFTTRKQGAGIGLTLSKNIMEAQNGHLTFKSKAGETVFLMSFQHL
ncbi:MAG: ATP-binding protein [Weeksellaceae bacterium]